MENMKYMGIDFGMKNVGVAISDEGGSMAFPRVVFDNDQKLVGRLGGLCEKENVNVIVIGKSQKLSGEENDLMDNIRTFAKVLGKETGKEIVFQDERFSTSQARRMPDDKRGENYNRGIVDDKAAAIILQSYLDSKKHVTSDM